MQKKGRSERGRGKERDTETERGRKGKNKNVTYRREDYNNKEEGR